MTSHSSKGCTLNARSIREEMRLRSAGRRKSGSRTPRDVSWRQFLCTQSWGCRPWHELDAKKLEHYLERRFGGPVRVLSLSGLGKEPAGDVKGYGYGLPVKVDFELSGQRRSAVLETVTPGPFGHEHMADRAQILLWSHAAFNHLPGHVRSLDVGGFSKNGSLVSVARRRGILHPERLRDRRRVRSRSRTASRRRGLAAPRSRPGRRPLRLPRRHSPSVRTGSVCSTSGARASSSATTNASWAFWTRIPRRSMA